jgi:hypothetical protein
VRYVDRRKLEAELFSSNEIAARKALLREGWIALLSGHLLKNLSGARRLEDNLLDFDGLAVIVKTKNKHFCGNEFQLNDLERLVVIKRNPPETFRPRWDAITSIEFRYLRPPSTQVRALLACH